MMSSPVVVSNQKPVASSVDGTSGIATTVARGGKAKHEKLRPARTVNVSSPNQFESSGGQDNDKTDRKLSRTEAAKLAYEARQYRRNARANNANLIKIVADLNGFHNGLKNGTNNLRLICSELKAHNAVVNSTLPKSQLIKLNFSTANLKKIFIDTHPPARLINIVKEIKEATAPINNLIAIFEATHPPKRLVNIVQDCINNRGKKIDRVVLPGDVAFGKIKVGLDVDIQTEPIAAPQQPVPPVTAKSPLPAPKPQPHIIWRKSPWWRRVIFKEVPSRLEVDRPDNLHIGTLIKHKHIPDRLTTHQDLVHKALYSYLLMNKFSKYNSRQECLDHMEKLGRKYWKDECKIDFGNMSAMMVNCHFITVQKAVDEQTTPYLLAEETQQVTRKQRFVKLPWKRTTKTTSPPWSPFHEIPQ